MTYRVRVKNKHAYWRWISQELTLDGTVTLIAEKLPTTAFNTAVTTVLEDKWGIVPGLSDIKVQVGYADWFDVVDEKKYLALLLTQDTTKWGLEAVK